MAKFVHNKSTANVSLINGKILVAVGGKEQVTDQEAEHEDVVHAKRAGWITIEGEKSSTAAPKAAKEPTLAEDPMKGSATIPVVTPKETATSSAIGAGDSEVAAEEVAAVKTNKSKKADKAAE